MTESILSLIKEWGIWGVLFSLFIEGSALPFIELDIFLLKTPDKGVFFITWETPLKGNLYESKINYVDLFSISKIILTMFGVYHLYEFLFYLYNGNFYQKKYKIVLNRYKYNLYYYHDVIILGG
jgi:hypothetical protein